MWLSACPTYVVEPCFYHLPCLSNYLPGSTSNSLNTQQKQRHDAQSCGDKGWGPACPARLIVPPDHNPASRYYSPPPALPGCHHRYIHARQYAPWVLHRRAGSSRSLLLNTLYSRRTPYSSSLYRNADCIVLLSIAHGCLLVYIPTRVLYLSLPSARYHLNRISWC